MTFEVNSCMHVSEYESTRAQVYDFLRAWVYVYLYVSTDVYVSKYTRISMYVPKYMTLPA
jgi:hypothetical protein